MASEPRPFTPLLSLEAPHTMCGGGTYWAERERCVGWAWCLLWKCKGSIVVPVVRERVARRRATRTGATGRDLGAHGRDLRGRGEARGRDHRGHDVVQPVAHGRSAFGRCALTGRSFTLLVTCGWPTTGRDVRVTSSSWWSVDGSPVGEPLARGPLHAWARSGCPWARSPWAWRSPWARSLWA